MASRLHHQCFPGPCLSSCVSRITRACDFLGSCCDTWPLSSTLSSVLASTLGRTGIPVAYSTYLHLNVASGSVGLSVNDCWQVFTTVVCSFACMCVYACVCTLTEDLIKNACTPAYSCSYLISQSRSSSPAHKIMQIPISSIAGAR